MVRDRVRSRDLNRKGGGGSSGVRQVDRQAHGGKLRGDLQNAYIDGETDRDSIDERLTVDDLQAQGVIVVLDAADPAFPLYVDSLERLTRKGKQPSRLQWLLLSVNPGSTNQPETAVVWVADEFRGQFLQLFEDFLNKDTKTGRPRNRKLVANIAQIRHAVLRDLWQSSGEPPLRGVHWWELWLARPATTNNTAADTVADLLLTYATALGLPVAPRRLELTNRIVMWVQAEWSDLYGLPFTAVPVAEIRRPEFVDTIHDLPRDQQDEYTADLVERTVPAGPDAPVVCHLDTGVRRSHALLAHSLAPGDVHSVVGDAGLDTLGHGTQMAGLALYGPLEQSLANGAPVVLAHRLESVKLIPNPPGMHDPLTYGLVTAQAAAAAEAGSEAKSGRRVFCMPVTAEPEFRPGDPSLWSASVDALSVGTDIAQSDTGIALVAAPDRDAARLFVISAGNVRDWKPGFTFTDYRGVCDLAGVEDPAQAWNALTVGAHTDLDRTPTDPDFTDWAPIAPAGDLSPHSRTAQVFGRRKWPIKPDICLEGGNLLTDGSDFHDSHPLLTVSTTSHRDDLALTYAQATSAATAQAARLAATAMAAYPNYWPETIRGLLVHAAEWTPAMRAAVHGATGKTARLAMLRRYGWGVPTEAAVLHSTRNAVTLVTQDEFVPFDGPNHTSRRFRLHRLPWPAEVLRDLGGTEVELRVTLSYFVEPSASRRGWQRRYAYASHGLRFELRGPLERRLSDFIARINTGDEDDEADLRPSGGTDRWFVGMNQRNVGSLHQDILFTTGAELADCDLLAVYPIGGWWKYNRRPDRINLPLRYSLILSLRTAETDIDLYTPITTTLAIPIQIDTE